MRNLNVIVLNYRFWIVFLGITIGYCMPLISQTKSNIDLFFLDAKPHFRIKKPDKISLDSMRSVIKEQYLENGYLDFSIDSTIITDAKTILFIHSGYKFKVTKIGISPEPFHEFSKSYILKRTLSPKFIELQNLQTLQSVQNLGYPYALLDKEILFQEGLATINYMVKSGNLVKFDSIQTSPTNLISYNYISKKTGIEVGKPYNYKASKNVKQNINQSQIFTVDSAYQILSTYQSKILVKLKKVSQNTFSALVGIQTDSENKSEITGNISIALANAFKKGEKIKFEWQKPGNESQNLETNLMLPYIFKLPVGVDLYGDFDKQDSTFTNTNLKLGLLMPTVNYGEYSINGKWQTSSVNQNQSTDLNSSNSTLYGIGYQFSLLDNPVLPQKGFSVNTQFFSGNINLINQSQADTKTIIFEWIGNIKIAFKAPLGSIYFKNEWGMLKNDSLKRNNFYRLGGANSMRGFNENIIYAKGYSFSNLEYRFYLNPESYLYFLYDAGYFKEPVNETINNIFRQALGLGLNVNTIAGHLSISYAIGKYGSDPFQFNEGKIHIGYLNRF